MRGMTTSAAHVVGLQGAPEMLSKLLTAKFIASLAGTVGVGVSGTLAATGTLPAPAQAAASRALDTVGISVPAASRPAAPAVTALHVERAETGEAERAEPAEPAEHAQVEQTEVEHAEVEHTEV